MVNYNRYKAKTRSHKSYKIKLKQSPKVNNTIPNDLTPYVHKPYGILSGYKVRSSVDIPAWAVNKIDKIFYKSDYDGMLYFRK